VRTLDRLVTDAAARRPDALAVVDGDRSITYGTLDALAARIAGALAAAGVEHGDVVVVHLPKSIEAIAAIHGVLRLGAAYLPLDSSAPAPRARATVDDARPRAAIISGATAATWHRWAEEGLEVVAVDVDALGTARAPARAIGLDDLAYVLYTSGSTGRPKGVELTHRNGAAFVEWAVDALGVRPEDRLSGHAPLHFDLSIFDVFAAAAAGAALALVPKVVSRFPVELARWIAEQRISVWYSVPTALSLLATRADLRAVDLTSLRTVLFAGEVFPPKHLAALVDALSGDVQLWNLYGPTETNVCTAHRVAVPVDRDGPTLPIGRVVAGDRVAVVDDDGRPVAVGAVGELVVCGPTVARGYRHAADLTAARFSVDGGERCYRTGDRVVQDPEGVLRFVGRADDQVKTRGHRVELGEVEAALNKHPDVVSSAVIAVPDELVTNVLHAFVELRPGADVAGRELLRHAAAHVPAAMVPASVEVIDALPRTSTDKIDRPALSARVTRSARRAPGSTS
jgi:amino acid adenylation domain-containing protein